MTENDKLIKHADCDREMLPIRDALDVLGGKWRIMILISLIHGNSRFRQIERSIPKISSKVLAKELKDLEQHKLVKRTVYDEYPVRVEYTCTDYSKSIEGVLAALHAWGSQHRKKIIGK